MADLVRYWVELARRHLDSLRPPDALGFSWKSVWPVPFYALACLAHKRVRVLKPRRLPTLTTIRVPEIYVALACGHVAHLEANRLARNMEAADWLKYICHGAKWAGPEYREHPERFVPTSKEPVDLTLHLVATGRATLIDFEIWKYAQRCSWTDERARLAASTFLMEHGWCASGLRQHLSTHDTGLVTLFLAEQLKGDSVLRPAFLHDKRLMAEVGIVTFFAMLSRSSWGSSSLGVQRTNAIMQRYFFYLLAFKWFAGKYCHYASILGLQDPMRAGVAVILAEGDMCSGKWKKSRVDVDTTFEGFDVTM